MSVSIYYTAKRSSPLTDPEEAAIHALVSKYSVDAQVEEYVRTGEGTNWESFRIYAPAGRRDLGVVFEGATKLPDDTWLGVQHWSRLLSEIRRVLRDAQWHVHVDDHDLVWDAASEAYALNR